MKCVVPFLYTPLYTQALSVTHARIIIIIIIIIYTPIEVQQQTQNKKKEEKNE